MTRKSTADLLAEIECLKGKIERRGESLCDCLDYFEQRMDAETFPDGSTLANEEMQMSMKIKEALR